MFERILVPDGEQLHVDEWKLERGIVKLAVTARQSGASCPDCEACSARVHSRYTRTLADLACAGFQLKLYWTVRRFFCDNPACGRVTFVEQLPTVAARYARKTQRLAEQQQHIAFHVGGEVGTRVMRCVHTPISPDTLLRLIRRAVEEAIETPRVLGVDDWAFRKEHNYGTILVNLETHRAIDLLPDRTAASLAAWLQAHPGIEVIGRDRSSEYIKGINIGAPDAIHAARADRWHLLKNLREALEGFLE